MALKLLASQTKGMSRMAAFGQNRLCKTGTAAALAGFIASLFSTAPVLGGDSAMAAVCTSKGVIYIPLTDLPVPSAPEEEDQAPLACHAPCVLERKKKAGV